MEKDYFVLGGDWSKYFVWGGEWSDTTFSRLVRDTNPIHYGEFYSYQEALDVWRAVSWQNVDNCHFRVFLVKGVSS